MHYCCYPGKSGNSGASYNEPRNYGRHGVQLAARAKFRWEVVIWHNIHHDGSAHNLETHMKHRQ
jgi:hypothetical protein